MRCCRGTRPTARPCATPCARSRLSTARPIASGSWIAAFRATRSLPRCERPSRPSRISSARPRAGFPSWRRRCSNSPGRRFARGSMSSFSRRTRRCTCWRRATHASTRNAPCGDASSKATAAWRLIDVEVAEKDATFTFALNRDKLRKIRRREGRYLLRTNLCDEDPAKLWKFYIQLVEIEAAFKNLKDDLQLRPIYHQLEHRIEAHIFVAFVAYCLHVTLRAKLKPLAPGLTPRAVLDKLAPIQMLDVHFPTTDGRTLILSRYTELNADQKLLVKHLKLDLPSQPPPRITAPAEKPVRRAVAQQV